MAQCGFCNGDMDFLKHEGKQVLVNKTNAPKYKHEEILANRCNKCEESKVNICSFEGIKDSISKIKGDTNIDLKYSKNVHSELQEI